MFAVTACLLSDTYMKRHHQPPPGLVPVVCVTPEPSCLVTACLWGGVVNRHSLVSRKNTPSVSLKPHALIGYQEKTV